jgi:hypothetical protein
MNCRICNHETNKAFTTKIMDKYDVTYYTCPNCEFLQTEKPYWLDEAYKLPINLTDTGILYRNYAYAKFTSAVISSLLDVEATYLDFAGGYGIFTRIMRDMGYDYLWDDQFTPNLIARGFEYKQEMGKVEAMTTFETFEHFVNPIEEMERMLKISDTIIFSTNLALAPVPPMDWWYYTFEHGQHVAFYREKTMNYLADQFGLHYYTNGGDFHMFTKRELVPVILEESQLKELITSLPAEERNLIVSKYKRYGKVLGVSPVESAKTIYRRTRFGVFHQLVDDIATDDHAKLTKIFAGANFLNKYFNYLLKHADTINHFFAEPQLKSKTVSDMLLMQPAVHAFHKQQNG